MWQTWPWLCADVTYCYLGLGGLLRWRTRARGGEELPSWERGNGEEKAGRAIVGVSALSERRRRTSRGRGLSL